MKSNKIFKRVLWESLLVTSASLCVFSIGVTKIADSKSGTLNDALGIDNTNIERSDDPQYQYYNRTYSDSNYDELKNAYVSIAEEVEGEGIVLLKNKNNALPLKANDKVSLMLSGSYYFSYSSSGSSNVDSSTYMNLKDSLTKENLLVNESMWDYYSGVTKRTTTKINDIGWNDISGDVKTTLNEYNTAIVTISRNSGEGSDIRAYGSDGSDGSYLSLNNNEISVLKGLTELKNSGNVSKIIVLLNSSATIQMDFLEADGIDVDACLWVGNVGNGIGGVAKVLTGEVNPSGKLSDTYVYNNFSSPAAQNIYLAQNKKFSQMYDSAYALQETNSYAGIYNEGIYVGYRYYETRYYDYVTNRDNTGNYIYSDDVAYSFGYGLSYTDFEYSNYSVNEKNGNYEISVTVKNVGDTSGKDVVQVYLQKPYTDYDIENGIEKSAVELVGYDKTKLLNPNESENITVTVSKERLKSYDENKAKTYILEAGDYYLTVANGAHEANNNILAKQGKTTANTNGRMDKNGNSSLVSDALKVTNKLDTESYSKSSYTGVSITNQLDFADINKYDGVDNTTTYVSRNNWNETFPVSVARIKVTEKMYKDLQINKEIKTNENAQASVYGQSNNLSLVQLRGMSYNDALWDKLLNQMSYSDQVTLITQGYFTTSLIASVGKPNTSESDGPTGVVGSKGSLSLPSEGIWASSFNDEVIYKVGDILAEDALANGKTGIYANGINIHRMPFGGRSHEYFSEDPYLTGMAAIAEINGIQSKGVIAHVKHIAFNDQEDARNGISIWLNEQEAREIMLLPFEFALSSVEGMGNAHAVMSGFNRVGTIWAGACTELLNNIMRDEWGFDGYCITDMAESNGDFMTYQDGIPNGTDLFLGNTREGGLSSYQSNDTFTSSMREACHRILYVVCNYSSAMNGINENTVIGAKNPWWKTTLTAIEITTGVLSALCAGMYITSLALEEKKKRLI